MECGDVNNTGSVFHGGLCRVLIREVNSEAKISSEYKDENGAWP
jgi:hypothetical protein